MRAWGWGWDLCAAYHVEVARDEREAAQVEEVELREYAHLQVGGQVAQEAQLPAAQALHVLARLLAEHAPDLICARTSSENLCERGLVLEQ